MRTILLMGLLATANANAGNTYLSRDICQIEFASLMKHSGQSRTSMRKDEINKLITKIKETSNQACLTQKTVRKLSKQSRRQKPYIENCWALEKRFYADRGGRTIYQLSTLEIKRAEKQLLNDDLKIDCLSPLLLE